MVNVLARVVAVAFLVPALASAQALRPQISLGGGMDAILYDGSTYVPSYVGQAGLEWRVGTRGALRLGLMHYQQNRERNGPVVAGCTAECDSWTRFGSTGFTFDGTFDLARGRYRPYLLSGVGMYRSSTTNGANFECIASDPTVNPFSRTCSYTGVRREFQRSTWAGGLHSGLGFSATFGKVALFTEGRIMILGTDGTRARGMFPVIFGVKF